MTEVLIIAGALALVFASGYGIRDLIAKHEIGAELENTARWLNEYKTANENIIKLRRDLDVEKKNNLHLTAKLSSANAMIDNLMMKLPARNEAGRFVKKRS